VWRHGGQQQSRANRSIALFVVGILSRWENHHHPVFLPLIVAHGAGVTRTMGAAVSVDEAKIVLTSQGRSRLTLI
jgi:hypothetical protein